jgi:hypothetical protein
LFANVPLSRGLLVRGRKDAMVKFEMPSEQGLAVGERRIRSVEKLAASRADRLKKLEERKESIHRALQAYRDLPDRFSTIWLRAEFVALRNQRALPPALGGPEHEQPLDRSTLLQDDYRTRPPSTKLLMHKTHALRSYLAMIFVAHAEGTTSTAARANASRAGGTESWAVLCGRWAPTVRARRARLARDLEELHRADLVTIGGPGVQARYENFGLLADDFSDRVYTVPKGQPGTAVIMLPFNFFANGWHLALSPAEIAVLLMVRHAERAHPPSTGERGIAVPRATRWAVYGISGEAYEAIHELHEFGLLSVYDTMPHRSHGKLHLLSPPLKAALEADGDTASPVPYRLATASFKAFDRSALEIIPQSLRDHQIPPRPESLPAARDAEQ